MLTPVAAALLAILSAGSLGTPAASTRIRQQVGACILEAPPEYSEHLQALAGHARRLLPRLEADLGVEPRGEYTILLIPPAPVDDEDLRRLDASAPSWAAGFLFPSRRLGGIRLDRAQGYPHDDTASVLVHEATHMLLHDAAGASLPRWFGEGVSTWEGRRWGLRDLFVYSSGLLTHRLPPLAELDGWFREGPSRTRMAYAASFDFVSWSTRRYGEDVVARILREEGPFPHAWEAATGETLAAAEARWRRGSLLRYRWLPALLGTTALWVAITALALLAGVRRRARSRAIRAGWEEEEGGDPPPPSSGLPPGGSEGIH
jgi:hypothetical protein